MKFAGRNNIRDLVAWNSGFVEEVDLDEFCELLWADNWQNEAIEFHDDIIELQTCPIRYDSHGLVGQPFNSMRLDIPSRTITEN